MSQPKHTPKSTPAKRGNPRKKANAALARQLSSEIHQARKAAAPGETLNLPKPLRQPKDQPRYGTGLRMDTPNLHYAVNDPAPPVNDGGKVVLNLANKSDAEVVEFTNSHISKMTGNENFPEEDQQPSAADFLAIAGAFSSAVTALGDAKRALSAAVAARDEAWNNLMNAGYGIRLPYVQIASNGNTPVILTSGLGVRAGRTPAGDLPSPASITATPGDNAGVMNLDWQIVAKARGYSIQYADASTTERNWMPLTTSNKAHCTVSGLTSGATLAFRVATNGGASGQSEWSYEIVRVVP